jgi:hypothetical protein
MSTRVARIVLRTTAVLLPALVVTFVGLCGPDTANAAANVSAVRASGGVGTGTEAQATAAAMGGVSAPGATGGAREDDSSPGGGSGSETDVEGFLISAPSGLVGVWVLESAPGITHTVIATTTTEFRDFGSTPPAPGHWIDARGDLQSDGVLLATRIDLDEFEDGQVVVRLAPGVAPGQFGDAHHLKLLKDVLASAQIYLYETEDNETDTVSQLSSQAGVVWAELNYAGRIPEGDPYRTWRWGGQDNSGYVDQAAFEQVNLAPAQTQFRGDGIVVAVLDTGVDQKPPLNHPALAGKLLPGRDMVADDADPSDEGPGVAWGHGTHVAGIVAHMAPASKILPVRVLDSNGRGNTFVLAYAIEWAVGQGADVINLSLGADFDSAVLSDTIQAAIAQGVVVVAAAGNDNSTAPHHPADLPGVLSVTAVDGGLRKAPFANYGAGWVDLAAPGVGITSTIVGPQGSGYATWSGTSMATPFTAGAAALAVQKLGTAASAQTVAALLTGGAQNIDAHNPAFAGQLGGFLDVGAALVGNPPPSAGGAQLFLPLVGR